MGINIIVSDEDINYLRLICNHIEKLIRKYNIEAKIVSYSKGTEVFKFTETIDMAFLAIEFSDINGIKLAEKLKRLNPSILIIFITSHREYAYDAFGVEAFGFLLKPYDPERFEKIFRKAIKLYNITHLRIDNIPLIITENNIKKKIDQCGILYIERVNTRSVIVTKTKKHHVYETITSLASRLDDNFIRISQGIIINIDEVVALNSRQAIMKTGEVFTVGRTYSKLAKKKYLELSKNKIKIENTGL